MKTRDDGAIGYFVVCGFAVKNPPRSHDGADARLEVCTGDVWLSRGVVTRFRDEAIRPLPLCPLRLIGVCKMGYKCRFVRPEAESQSTPQRVETNGGAAPPISKIRGASWNTRKVGNSVHYHCFND